MASLTPAAFRDAWKATGGKMAIIGGDEFPAFAVSVGTQGGEDEISRFRVFRRATIAYLPGDAEPPEPGVFVRWAEQSWIVAPEGASDSGEVRQLELISE